MPMHDAAPERTAEFFASLPRDRTLIMGILNLTPDSFSDGGVHYGRGADRAVADALEMVRAGADLIDVGGESTRPGASPVDPEQERERILEVIARLAAEGVRSWPRVVSAAFGALVMVAIGILWGIGFSVPGWWPVAEHLWLVGGWATGVTIIVSGGLALGLITYSVLRFRPGLALVPVGVVTPPRTWGR